jgi:hypothetical protein
MKNKTTAVDELLRLVRRAGSCQTSTPRKSERKKKKERQSYSCCRHTINKRGLFTEKKRKKTMWVQEQTMWYSPHSRFSLFFFKAKERKEDTREERTKKEEGEEERPRTQRRITARKTPVRTVDHLQYRGGATGERGGVLPRKNSNRKRSHKKREREEPKITSYELLEFNTTSAHAQKQTRK